MPEDLIKAKAIREFARRSYALSDHQFWRTFNPLKESGRIVPTHAPGENAHLLSLEHSRILLDALRANPKAKKTDAELPDALKAIDSIAPPKPADPPAPKAGAAGKAATAKELATSSGTTPDPSLAPKPAETTQATDPDPAKDPGPVSTTAPGEPAPKRKKIPRRAFMYLVVAGVGIVGVVAVRSWWKTRQGAPSTLRHQPIGVDTQEHDPVADFSDILASERSL